MISVKWLSEATNGRWAFIFVTRTQTVWLFKYPGPPPGLSHVDAMKRLADVGALRRDDLWTGAETGMGYETDPDPGCSSELSAAITSSLLRSAPIA